MFRFLKTKVLTFIHKLVQSSYNLMMVYYNARKLIHNLGF